MGLFLISVKINMKKRTDTTKRRETMATTIIIESGDIRLTAVLNDSETARAIAGLLPLEGSVNRWGEEIYFKVPLQRELDSEARDDMEVGELGYWPTGSAFCIFWGPTPASDGDKPRAAGPVNVIGTVEGDAALLSSTKNGDPIKVFAK